MNQRKKFGKKLIELREFKELRQSDVAEIINLSQRSIGRLERGEIASASVDSLIELSKVYEADILTLYKKYVYGDFYILEDIKRTLDINAMFLSKDLRINLLEKIEIIKDSKDLDAKKYEIDLLELFIKYINLEILDNELVNRFECLSSDRIKRKTFFESKLLPIEYRILLNIATTSKSFKKIDKIEIFENCINQNIDIITKILSCNNFSNFYIINKDYKKAIRTTNNGIKYSIENSFTDGMLYLHFTNFLASYRSYNDYEEPLIVLKALLKNNINKRLKFSIDEKIKNILD